MQHSLWTLEGDEGIHTTIPSQQLCRKLLCWNGATAKHIQFHLEEKAVGFWCVCVCACVCTWGLAYSWLSIRFISSVMLRDPGTSSSDGLGSASISELSSSDTALRSFLLQQAMAPCKTHTDMNTHFSLRIQDEPDEPWGKMRRR